MSRVWKGSSRRELLDLKSPLAAELEISDEEGIESFVRVYIVLFVCFFLGAFEFDVYVPVIDCLDPRTRNTYCTLLYLQCSKLGILNRYIIKDVNRA